jgi:hypothetical protein
VALHAVASILCWLVQFGYGWMHPDDRSGFLWILTRAGCFMTSVPILWLFWFGGAANRVFEFAWPVVFVLNSLLAVALLWLGVAAVQGACRSTTRTG